MTEPSAGLPRSFLPFILGERLCPEFDMTFAIAAARSI